MQREERGQRQGSGEGNERSKEGGNGCERGIMMRTPENAKKEPISLYTSFQQQT